MIINTGQRTDIPAFFSDWFMNRVNEGFVLVRNPYNASAVTRFTIDPKLVDLIGFCTKNPEPMLPYVKELDERGFGQFWHMTITPYGRDIEPNVPDKNKCLETFIKLSALVGVNRIAWRYDPILISQKYSADYHRRAFEKMAAALCGWTDSCVISFIDLFAKVKKNFPEARSLNDAEKIELGRDLIKIAENYKMKVRTCGEGNILKDYGAIVSGCITQEVYERAVGCKLLFPRFKPSRSECACYLSCDIGAYSTCAHYCRYCYANSDWRAVKENAKRHDPRSPFLVGGSLPGDTVRQAEQRSWKASAAAAGQRELF